MRVGLRTGENFTSQQSRQLHSFAKNLYKQHGVLINYGKGAYLKDSSGKNYVDFHGMYGAVPFGHAPKEFKPVFDALMNGDLPMTHGAFPKDSAEEAARRLAEKTAESIGGRPEDRQVYFNNTGAEAVEAAFKFARQHGYRVKGIPDDEKIIVAMSGNFHGRTIGTSLFHPDKTLSREGFGPLTPGIVHINWNDADGARKYLTENGAKIAAVIMEPIQGEGGINMPHPNFVLAIAEVCRSQNILIIADEVQSGLNRTGHFWASELYGNLGFQPDIITSAKALGGGVSLVGAVIMTNAVADVIKPGMHGSTFGGNSIAMAVVNKMLDVMEEQDIAGNVKKQAKVLDDQLHLLMADNPEVIIGLTGTGMWRGIEIDPDLSTDKVTSGLIKCGVITGESGRNVLRIAPPLNIQEGDLAKGVERLSDGFADISKQPDAYSKEQSVSRGRV